MPFYTDPTLYSSPVPSYALYLSGPYSNHSSLIGASSYARSNAYSKPLSRFHRGYAPHLATITENKVNSSLRRKYSPHLSALHSSHKYIAPRPIRINTADIDVSADRYKPRPVQQITPASIRPREYKRETSKSPSPKLDDAEFVPKPIRRDRPTVRLHTVRKGEEKDEQKSIKKEDEKFSHEATQKNQHLNKLEKNPSFHDICTAISHDKINEQLNPGQPEEICRLQSRSSHNEDFLTQSRRNSSELTKDNIALLDQILQEEEKARKAEKIQKTDESQTEENKFDSRNSVKRKKKIVKKKTNESLVSDEETTPLQKRPLKKIKRTSTNSSLQSDTSDNFSNSDEVIRDISNVEIEEIKTKPKPLISGIVNVEETISNLKLVVDDVKVEEVLSPKTHPKKFKFNVTVNVEATAPKVNKIIPPKTKITDENKGKVHLPKAKGAIISNVRQNNKQRGSLGDIYEDKEIPRKLAKKTDLHKNHLGLNSDIQADKPEDMKFKNEGIKSEAIREEITATKKCDINNLSDVKVEKIVDVLLVTGENKNDVDRVIPNGDIQNKDSIENCSALVNNLVDEILSKDEKKSFNFKSSSIDKMKETILPSSKQENKANEYKDKVFVDVKVEDKNSISLSQDNVLDSSTQQNKNFASQNPTIDKLQNKTLSSPKEEIKSSLLPSPSVEKRKDNILQNKPEEKLDVNKVIPKTPFQIAQKKLFTEPNKNENENKKLDFRKNLNKVQNITIKDQTSLKKGPQSPVTKSVKTPTPPPLEEEQDFWDLIGTRRSVYHSSSTFFKKKSEDMEPPVVNNAAEKVNGLNLDQKHVTNEENKIKLQENILNKINERKTDEIKSLNDKKEDLKTVIAKDKKEELNVVIDKKDKLKPVTKDIKEELKTNANDNKEGLKSIENDAKPAIITNTNTDTTDTNKNETVPTTDAEEIIPKKMTSKEIEPEPEPEPESPQPNGFVPLRSNSLSHFMHPFKKPEQFDECPVEIYATPKTIRKRHYPRPRNSPPPPVQTSTDSEDDGSEETSDDTDDTSEEETTSSDDGGNVGKSTSSNDSGFNSSNGSSAMHTNKGSTDARDSPTSNPAHNPAFALDPGDNLEELFTSSTYVGFQKSGRITPPATTIPRFRKYSIEDFNFLKVLGKGSFGKVLLAELKDTEYYYAIKCLKKDVVLEDDDVECTLIERKVLALGTKHPYLCHLLCTFQTESHLFFVMEYLNGGDLMFHIQTSGRFPEARACIYAAEIVSGLKFLHSKGIIYRDLKLDNILLDFDGHVRIADFGMCKLQIFLDRTADTFCGTPDYMAPEIIKGLHYNQNADWWSYGVLLYEMLIGQSPFSGCDEDELFWSICNEKPVFPRFLSPEALSILKQLLEKDSNKRLGNKFCPHGDIQDHIFFRSIQWDLLERRQLDSPFKPNLQHPLDTQYFDRTFTVEKAKLTPIDKNILQSMDQAQFQGFSYTNPNATDR